MINNEIISSYKLTLPSINSTDILNVHVQRPPAVTLNETPKEFHISTGLCQKI